MEIFQVQKRACKTENDAASSRAGTCGVSKNVEYCAKNAAGFAKFAHREQRLGKDNPAKVNAAKKALQTVKFEVYKFGSGFPSSKKVKFSRLQNRFARKTKTPVKLNLLKKARWALGTKKIIGGVIGSAERKISSRRIDKNEISNSGIEAARLAGQAYDYAKKPIVIAKNAVGTFKKIAQAPRRINAAVRAAKTTANTAKFAAKQSLKIARQAVKFSQKAAVFAVKSGAKIAVLAVRTAAVILTNPIGIATVGAVLIVVIATNAVSNAVLAANVALQGTVGWLLDDSGDDQNYTQKMRERYEKYVEIAGEMWDIYAEKIIGEYSGYDEISSNSDFFRGVDKTNFFAVLYTKKLKENPNLPAENLNFSRTEIADFLPKYTKFDAATGSYERSHSSTTTDADGNSHTTTWTETVTTANITFGLNENVTGDFGFTDAENAQVHAVEEVLAEIFEPPL